MPLITSTWTHINLFDHINSNICLIHLGWEKCTPGHSYTNYRNFYLVHYIKSGKGTLYIDEKEIHLKANDTFLIKPGQVATYTADKHDPWEYYYFAFSGSLAPELYNNTVFCDNTPTYTFPEQNDCNIYFNDSIYALQPLTNRLFLSLETLFRLLKLFDKNSTANKIIHSKVEKNVLSVEQFIQKYYNDKELVFGFIKDLNIDKSYFFRIFKKHTGKSVEKYLLDLRIHQAKLLISNTSLDFKQVANQVGYSNYVSFYKLFKKCVNMSPEEFRAKSLK